ncbi:hypothetical protein [Bryocella elongata]|nr:hypothetical protein [Bryocella elongata]
MAKWPRSGWAHAGVAVVVGSLACAAAFGPLEQHYLAEAVREAPHDGQDGLAAFAGAMEACVAIWLLVAGVVFVVQRLLTRGK